jgi:hypothetical protein
MDNITDLEELKAAGVGEGDFDDDHSTPAELLELHEVLEWQAAVEAES